VNLQSFKHLLAMFIEKTAEHSLSMFMQLVGPVPSDQRTSSEGSCGPIRFRRIRSMNPGIVSD
jgi:hypothetical protein